MVIIIAVILIIIKIIISHFILVPIYCLFLELLLAINAVNLILKLIFFLV